MERIYLTESRYVLTEFLVVELAVRDAISSKSHYRLCLARSNLPLEFNNLILVFSCLVSNCAYIRLSAESLSRGFDPHSHTMEPKGLDNGS